MAPPEDKTCLHSMNHVSLKKNGTLLNDMTLSATPCCSGDCLLKTPNNIPSKVQVFLCLLAKISTALPIKTICQLNVSMNVRPVLPMNGHQKRYQLHHVNSEEQYIDWHRNRIIFSDYVPLHFQTHEPSIYQLELQCFTC